MPNRPAHRFAILFVALAANSAYAGSVQTLVMDSYGTPPPNYQCTLTNLNTRAQLFGDYTKRDGCRIQIKPRQFSQHYSVCWLSGVQVTDSAPHTCRVQTYRGTWDFTASIRGGHGKAECTFLCLAPNE